MNKYTKFKLVGELETTISGKLLYLVLLDVVDEKNQIIIPQKRVSEALGISRSTVSRNLGRLRNNGYIGVIPQYNEYGGRMPNKYIVREDDGKEKDMRIELTKQEVIWLTELAEKEKYKAIAANDETPHGVLELRRDNMNSLEEKLRNTINNQIKKERNDAR